MRLQYCELKVVGGLTIQNSTFNMMQEIKTHQQDPLQNLRADIRNGILKTLHAFNMQNAQNQENIPRMYNQNTQYNVQPYYPSH